MKRDMINQFLLFFLVMLSYPCLFDSHSLHLINSSSNISFSSCRPHQSSILLQLKSEFTFQMRFAYSIELGVLEIGYPKMKSWKAGSDCCSSWDGVSCDMATGHVISLDLSDSWLHGPLRSNSSLFSLLHLRKLNLAFNYFSCPIPSEFGQLSRLTHLNLSDSMFSGHIPISEISTLTNLISLDLSHNYNWVGTGDFALLYMREGEVGRLTQNMTNLRQLHLDWANLSSPVPIHFANLSSLTHLSLADCNLHGEFPSNIFHLPNIQSIHLSENDNLTGSLPEFHSGSMLKFLDLSSTSFSGKLPNSIGNLKSLNILMLSECSFSGIVPSSLWNLTELKHLDLAYNSELTGSLPEFSSGSMLKLLDLSSTSFSGKLPNSIGNLKSLNILRLGFCSFSGIVPSSLWNLTELKHLYLPYNEFSGQIPSSFGNLTKLEILMLSQNLFSVKLPISLPHHIQYIGFGNSHLTGSIPSIIHNLTFLVYLDLSDNSLTGVIPGSLFKMPSLTFLILDNNQFTGYLNMHNVSNSSQLEDLSLSGNKLTGHIPSSISKFTMLSSLDLSSNDLTGRFDFGIFSKLNLLSHLHLSNNRGLFITNLSTNSTLPKFLALYLSSCNIREFPLLLKTQDELEDLDLSSNNISDPIPKWLLSVGTQTLRELNLSHNFIRSWEKAPLILPWKAMVRLDLHSNMLHGSLVVPPMSTDYFSISENSLVGKIDPLFCKLGNLVYLDLSSNKLSGTIPQCLGNFNSNLVVLNLRRNNLNGNMPKTCGDTNQLHTLDLSYNNLHGKIPKSLIKCKELRILNLGHNQMTDTFPFMVQSLSKLQVLILSSNKFYGPIWHPNSFFGFVNLSIIDLSFNDFTGSLPSDYFRNWISMKASYNMSQSKYIGTDSYYNGPYYSVTMINKGLEIPYLRILIFYMSIDFSNNKFYGEIPSTIGDIRNLVVLNLSSNNFAGHIPSSLGNLIELESLDLSNNELSGEIPQQLTSLTFLGYLNLSKNQLTGPIPQARQIGTFSNSSFEGNWGLCGPPLSKKCGTSPLPPSHDNEKSGDSILSGFGWKAVAIGYGCGLIIGLMLGYIITSRNPYLVFKLFRVIPPRRLRRANN